MASALSSLLTGKRPLSTKDQKSNFKQWLDSAEKEEEAKIAECPSAKKSRPSSDKWWELPEQKLTPEVRRDLQIIQSRSYLDPKRFYKTAKEQRKLPTRFQIGTVVESPFDGPGGRLTNAERESSIALSLLHDESFKEYGQKYVNAISDAKAVASKKGYRKRGAARRRGHRK